MSACTGGCSVSVCQQQLSCPSFCGCFAESDPIQTGTLVASRAIVFPFLSARELHAQNCHVFRYTYMQRYSETNLPKKFEHTHTCWAERSMVGHFPFGSCAARLTNGRNKPGPCLESIQCFVGSAHRQNETRPRDKNRTGSCPLLGPQPTGTAHDMT